MLHFCAVFGSNWVSDERGERDAVIFLYSSVCVTQSGYLVVVDVDIDAGAVAVIVISVSRRASICRGRFECRTWRFFDVGDPWYVGFLCSLFPYSRALSRCFCWDHRARSARPLLLVHTTSAAMALSTSPAYAWSMTP